MNLPVSSKDPIFHKKHADLCASSRISFKHKHLTTKENFDSVQIKQIPSGHYIESRFNAYNQAKLYNRPLFSNIHKHTEELSDRSTSATRFRSSRYPKVPLTKELSEKVQQVNTFRDSCKRSTKKESIQRPVSNLSLGHKQTRPNMILLNLKSWDKLKRESFRKNNTLANRVFQDLKNEGWSRNWEEGKMTQPLDSGETPFAENFAFRGKVVGAGKQRSCFRSQNEESI